MKCEKCGGEWIPPKGLSVSLTNCPFCGTPLLNTETAGGYTEMSSFLEYLVSLYGSDLYKDSRKLNNLISDLYRGDERMKRAYRRAMLDDTLSIKVYELSLKPINERMVFYDKLTSNFAEANFYTQEFGKQIVDSFVKGLKLEILPPISTKATKEDGEWIDEFGVKYSADRKKLIEGNRLSPVSTEATEEDGEWIDEFGVKYSADKTKLIKGNKKLKKYNIREGTVIICDDAFCGCKALIRIIIPSSVYNIGNWAFRRCYSLKFATIPSTVKSIGTGAFCGCSSLTKFTIPSSVISLGNSIFSGCSSLTSIIIPSSVKSIGEGAFCGCHKLNLSVDNNQYYYIKNDILYDKNTNMLLWCSQYVKEVIVPSSIKSIGEGAFCGCSSLTRITIPSSVKNIGKSAFIFCGSLNYILIPTGSTEKFKKLLPPELHQYLKETKMKITSIKSSWKRVLGIT